MDGDFICYNPLGEPLFIFPALFNALKKEEEYAELLALYAVYYSTSKWEEKRCESLSIEEEDQLISRKIKWPLPKVKRLKNILINKGIIKKVKNNRGTTDIVIGIPK